LGVIEAGEKRGLSVPEDLSVAGFDDVPEAATSTPSLTTVHQDHVKKGELAGRLLVAQFREEETEDKGFLPARLIVRGSTGRPSGAS
jgi:DNA-binding LacI/PurR family transcriptional regulator